MPLSQNRGNRVLDTELVVAFNVGMKLAGLDQTSSEGVSQTMRWKVIGLIVFAIIIAVFTLDNTTSVDVNFFFATATTKLIFVILLSVLLGMILMAILWSLRAWKLRSQMGALKKQLAKAEDELEALRSQERIQEEQKQAEQNQSDAMQEEQRQGGSQGSEGNNSGGESAAVEDEGRPEDPMENQEKQ